MSLELHLLDFEGDLYGKELEADFLHFLRPEKKFASAQALVSQIKKDEKKFRRWLS